MVKIKRAKLNAMCSMKNDSGGDGGDDRSYLYSLLDAKHTSKFFI